MVCALRNLSWGVSKRDTGGRAKKNPANRKTCRAYGSRSGAGFLGCCYPMIAISVSVECREPFSPIP